MTFRLRPYQPLIGPPHFEAATPSTRANPILIATLPLHILL